MSDLTAAVDAVNAAKPAKVGVAAWEPPAELAAALLEQYVNGVSAGVLADALAGTAYAASPDTVRKWLRRNEPT